jgi:glycosyltransferase involved in cell wall biosynthesis
MVDLRGRVVTVGVVIPAHNEAARVAAVIVAAVTADVGPVVVVADNCTDRTAEVAQALGTEVVEISAGDKGTAMVAGAARLETDDVLFLDGDLEGLRAAHVSLLTTAPPRGGMVVGLRSDTISTGLPPITGERRLPLEFFSGLKIAGLGYRAELVIDAAVARAGMAHARYKLLGVTNPSRSFRHPLMWADLALEAVVLAPDLALYVTQEIADR